MSTSSSHHDLFQEPSAAEKISFVRSLMETGDLNADIAMALLKSIHSELAHPQERDHAHYASYARMMASLQHEMPEVHQHVVTNWQAPRRADIPAEAESAEEGFVEAETSRDAKRTATSDVKEADQGKEFWETEDEMEGSESETEEHEESHEVEERKEEEELKNEEREDEESKDEEREQEEEPEEEDREQEKEAEPEKEENETREEPLEAPEAEESAEGPDEPEELEALEESDAPEEHEEEVEESEKAEVEASKEVEGTEGNKTAEEGERMATEAAEAAAHMEHVENEAEFVEEEEPPMEAAE